MSYPSNNFCQNPFITFSVIRWIDKQTDRQTDRSENITSFFGAGNNNNIIYKVHNVSKAESETLAIARWVEIEIRVIG